MNIKVTVLGSTSAGNSTLIQNSDTNILVDCGFGPRYMKQMLDEFQLSYSDISAVLITHLHSDHINENVVGKFLSEDVPLFVSTKIRNFPKAIKEYSELASRIGLLKRFNSESFSVGSFSIQSFEVPHDAPGGCNGFTLKTMLNNFERKITISTDLGQAEDALIIPFMDSDVIVIESNHDVEMLRRSKRPNWLKMRILNAGHLSNDQSAEFIEKVLSASTKKPDAIILAHISQECNTNFIATDVMNRMLEQNNYNAIKVIETYQRKPSKTIVLE